MLTPGQRADLRFLRMVLFVVLVVSACMVWHSVAAVAFVLALFGAGVGILFLIVYEILRSDRG